MSKPQEPVKAAANAPSLRAVTWKRFLRAPDAQLLDDLYVPALSRAAQYDRCCAYFSSSVLSAAARGFGGLIQTLLSEGAHLTRPAVRLLVNEQLDPADLKALLATGDQGKLIEKLLKQFKTPQDALSKRRLGMLAWLVAEGWLEVRVGLMRHPPGILHAKFGIVTDRHGDALAFMGSDNETGQALVQNYEQLIVGCSWEDAGFVSHYREEFDTLWHDRDAHVTTLSLPEAVKQQLIKLAPKEPPTVEPRPDQEALKTAMLWRFIAAAPYLPNGEHACDATALVDLWPHQHRVVADTAGAFPAGRLLCDEVGMGKTIEAILILRRLLAGRGVRRALLLPPAGLLRQWQDELREKGGLLVPRWENNVLYFPNGESKKMDAPQALAGNDLLLLSREWARLSSNREMVLSAPAWDLVLMDEAHAARRSAPVEGEFNSANLLLRLLRDLQLRRQTRGILLLSATPMQTQPWEPWDLLATLGVGGRWLVSFEEVRSYYDGVAALSGNTFGLKRAATIARLVTTDEEFPQAPTGMLFQGADDLASKLVFGGGPGTRHCASWLRSGAPLGRRMHRNTRDTLREYHKMGLLDTPPPQRQVRDEVFDYDDPAERACYEAIDGYIEKRFDQLENEKPGKGFVMTIYRRRASSSPRAFRRSLERRLELLNAKIHQQSYHGFLRPDEAQLDTRDDAEFGEPVDLGLAATAVGAGAEKAEVVSLLHSLEALGATDSKFSRFRVVLDEVTADGRSVLVFTEYTDTMSYLRDQLLPTYGATLGCFSGEGGQVWEGGEWQAVSKAEITQRLTTRALRVLVCTDAASEGLNLQAASALINYDLPWNPSKVEQRIGRIDRIGQGQSLLPVRNLFLDRSVDMAVYKALRLRCGLFEHFVGRMQPVLALARDALRGNLRRHEVDLFLGQLDQEVAKAKSDVAVGNAFVQSSAQATQMAEAPVTRADLEKALARLKEGCGKVRAVAVKGQPRWRLTGLGSHTVEVSLKREALERDRGVVPLTPAGEVVQKLSERLALPGQVPLVLAEHAAGPYRCIEARWVLADGTTLVKSAAQLEALLEGWQGEAPPPGAALAALGEARKAAKARVERMQQAAQEAEEAGLRRQLDAARMRLLRELARTLRCLRPGDLNGTFRLQAQREPSPDGRYRRALHRLGGFPHWTAEQLADAEVFADALTPNERQKRVALASELDAALNDPRWAACVGSHDREERGS